MKVVFPTCCGVDVHKSFLVATIIKTPKDSLQPSYQKKRFSTFNSDLNRFADWLHANDCLDACMESTGKYWVPVFNILEKCGIRVVIANPKWVKAVKGCQRQSEIVRKRLRNFVVFRRGGNRNQVLPCSKRVLTICCFWRINSLRSFRR